MIEKELRVRFAPSPTGELHIGSARTALFNYLFAKASGAKMIIRIEDTDEKRSTDESLRTIIDGMKWLGLEWDEGPEIGGISPPYFQSERIELHKEYAQKLIEAGKTYYCDCVGGENAAECHCREKDQKALKESGNAAIRFHIPEGVTEVNDVIRGLVTFVNTDIKDFVILKSNGHPVYNFAVVVDDITMGVTHIIRGEDHLSNTPKQILLYKAFGVDVPVMAHLPLINSPLGGKLSKRQILQPKNDPNSPNYVPAVNIEWYREHGFLPEAFVNYLVLLGWNDETDQEIYSLKELETKFTLERVSKTPALFDWKKLKWFNGKYIRDLSPEKYLDLTIPYLLKEYGNDAESRGIEWINKLVLLYQERVEFLADIGRITKFYFARPSEFNAKDVSKVKWDSDALSLMTKYRDVLAEVESFDDTYLENLTHEFVEKEKVDVGRLIHPVRLAVSGGRATPGIFAVLNLLGKHETIERLDYFMNNIKPA